MPNSKLLWMFLFGILIFALLMAAVDIVAHQQMTPHNNYYQTTPRSLR